jgi:hypothetical protein
MQCESQKQKKKKEWKEAKTKDKSGHEKQHEKNDSSPEGVLK